MDPHLPAAREPSDADLFEEAETEPRYLARLGATCSVLCYSYSPENNSAKAKKGYLLIPPKTAQFLVPLLLKKLEPNVDKDSVATCASLREWLHKHPADSSASE